MLGFVLEVRWSRAKATPVRHARQANPDAPRNMRRFALHGVTRGADLVRLGGASPGWDSATVGRPVLSSKQYSRLARSSLATAGRAAVARATLLEARTGFEPACGGFANRCLTTWLPRHPRNRREARTMTLGEDGIKRACRPTRNLPASRGAPPGRAPGLLGCDLGQRAGDVGRFARG